MATKRKAFGVLTDGLERDNRVIVISSDDDNDDCGGNKENKALPTSGKKSRARTKVQQRPWCDTTILSSRMAGVALLARELGVNGLAGKAYRKGVVIVYPGQSSI